MGLGSSTEGAADCAAAAASCVLVNAKDPTQKHAVLQLRRDPAGQWLISGTACVVAGPAQVTAAMVRDHAVRLIPAAAIGVAPKTWSLVNIQTVLWVDAPSPQTLPAARILGRDVRITIRLRDVRWNFGDGVTETASNAGKAYDDVHDPCSTKLCPHYDGHVYSDSGPMTITATAEWSATFTVGGGNAVTIPGTIAGPTARTTITVKQARGVLVPNPGEH